MVIGLIQQFEADFFMESGSEIILKMFIHPFSTTHKLVYIYVSDYDYVVSLVLIFALFPHQTLF